MEPGSLAPEPPPSRPAREGESWAIWLVAALLLGACVIMVPLTCSRGVRAGRERVAAVANEISAQGALMDVYLAQQRFRQTDADGDGVADFATSLDELGRAGLIDPDLASGMRDGYTFEVVGAGTSSWSATADPVRPGHTGGQGFIIDESGVVRASTAGQPPRPGR